MDLHPNHGFMVSQAMRLGGTSVAALDYGCGSGEVVRVARSQGVEMVGADIFQEGEDGRIGSLRRTGEFGKTIFRMEQGRLPFLDSQFGFVCSNQVFEHVQDIDLALSEIRRVLKPGGVFLNIFPSIGVLREGHCGVPLAHWLNRFPTLQYGWLWSLAALGLGYSRDAKTRAYWASEWSNYLRHFTHYRSLNAIRSAYLQHGLTWGRAEHEFAAYRLSLRGRRRASGFAARHPRLVRPVISRLASMVLISRAV